MKNLKYFLIASLTFLSSCNDPFTNADNGKTINLSEDDPFEIVLEGDVNSEFTWKLETKLQFTQLEKPVVKTKKGTIETYTFNFKTVSDGEEFIRLLYSDGIDIKKTFELKIIVGEMGLIEAE